MTEYMIALGLTICVSALNREAFMSVLVVAANFIANECFVRAFPDTDPVLWFSLMDGAAAFVLGFGWRKLPDFGRVGAVVAAIYCTQIIAHWSYWLTPDASQYAHWQTLTALAFVQLFFLAIGSIYGGGRMVRRVLGLRRVSPLHASPDRRSAEQGGSK